jgi:hypothetical protein
MLRHIYADLNNQFPFYQTEVKLRKEAYGTTQKNDGSVRCWKASRREENAGMKMKRKD